MVTDVRILLCDANQDRLLAFCSITLDYEYVIRDLKVICGERGLFVAMPSRKLTDRCRCGGKNQLRARFCQACGERLKPDRAVRQPDGRAVLHADIAHPVTKQARQALENAVIRAYEEELEKSKLPGYVSRYNVYDEGDEFAPLPHQVR